MRRRTGIWFATLIVLALVAAACGDDADNEDATDAATADTQADSGDTPAEQDEAPAEDDPPAAEEEPPAEEDDPPAAEEPIASITIWADDSRVGPLEAIAPAFTEETGVEVNVELVDFGGIRDQVSQAAPAGEGPDIFVGAHDWTGELAANGVVAPINLGDKADHFVQVALDGFNFAGEVFAVPYATEAVAMYRNSDLVPETPATWDDLRAACDAVEVANCVTVPGGEDAADAYHNYPFVSARGGGIFAFDASSGFDASQVVLDSDDTIAGVEILEAQVADGYVSSTNYGNAKDLFLTGQAAFFITGPWELGSMRDQSDINWAVSVIAQMGDAPVQPFVGAQGFFLNAFSENSLIAQSFLLDFIATDETMQALFDADGRPPAWLPVVEALSSNPDVQVFGASIANGIPMPNIPEMGAVWGPLGDNLLQVRNGESTAADAMTAAAEAVRAAVGG
ncbi:MAG: extracellular solute-binding protein [Acidimicrobiaceae bacterium]|nr:extracellular solute-binding protein [Acidimicrobiaceae bacterium]